MAENLAITHSNRPAIRRFAQRALRDHQREFSQLNALANNLGVPLNTAFANGDSEAINRLSGLFGNTFNREFLLNEIQRLLSDINNFTAEARNGTNSTVRAFANRRLPELRLHLQLAFIAVAQSGTRF